MSQLQIQQKQSKYEEYAHVLETSDIEQYFGHFADFGQTGKKKCAMGVLMAYRGWDGNLWGNLGTCSDKVRKELGHGICYDIQNKNDVEKLTFKEIAQWLRKQD
jgi:hypothetical protein